jgi:hypothetical protein
VTPTGQVPLWVNGNQTDLRNFISSVSTPSTPGTYDKDQGGPADDSWHSREPTHVQGARPDSGVSEVCIEKLDYHSSATGPTNTGLRTIKSEVSLASEAASGAASNIKASADEPSKTRTRFVPWLRSPRSKKQSRHESCYDSEEAAGGHRTDVLEVWFAGGHSGESLSTKKTIVLGCSILVQMWVVVQTKTLRSTRSRIYPFAGQYQNRNNKIILSYACV